jgi:hypothetical protein
MNPRVYQAIVIARGIEFFLRTGRRINTAYTPSGMLRTAHNILGTEAPARASTQALQVAAVSLRTWVQEQPKGN